MKNFFFEFLKKNLLNFFGNSQKEIKCVKMKEQGKVIPIEAAYGVWQQNRTSVQFMRSPESLLNLTGKAVSMTGNIINPDFDFSKVGIGGLDEEFKGKMTVMSHK